MSVQFGKCNLDGSQLDPGDFDAVRPILASHGQDGEDYLCKNNFGIVYRANHTTKESCRERQPHISARGTVLIWDGRLDNRQDVLARLHGELDGDSTDLEIVAAAYQTWGTGAFAMLVGDWALSILEPQKALVILAKDFLGARPLYYSIDRNQLTWCSLLEPLLLSARCSLELEEEYLAGWLGFLPAPHLTPYRGIHSVPASSFLWVTNAGQRARKYWDFDPAKRLSYTTDAAYEEHFRHVLAESVRRRLRSDAPVVAELSGGMDSSSIVCLADKLISKGLAETPRLDTVSYYDTSEPNWNEHRYFTEVEERRGRSGYHIDVGSQPYFEFQRPGDGVFSSPASVHTASRASLKFAAALSSSHSRVLLSGIGGDEFLGGVPTAVPELADLFQAMRFRTLFHQLRFWALDGKKACVHLLLETIREFLPCHLGAFRRELQPPNWLTAQFFQKHRATLAGYQSRLKLFGPRPSFQDNVLTLAALRRPLACPPMNSMPAYEKRYPYLDRDLLEFLFAIPREQLIRPGQRRSLMRRALVQIVPPAILARKRKAYVTRGPSVALSAEWSGFVELTRNMLAAKLEIIDAVAFAEELQKARNGKSVLIASFVRALEIECWLRHLEHRGALVIFEGHPLRRPVPSRQGKLIDESAETSLICRWTS